MLGCLLYHGCISFPCFTFTCLSSGRRSRGDSLIFLVGLCDQFLIFGGVSRVISGGDSFLVVPLGQ